MSSLSSMAAEVDAYLRDHSVSLVAAGVLTNLRAQPLDALDRDALWADPESEPDPETAASLAGFVVFVVAAVLADHALSPDEKSRMRLLKCLLRIEEGDLLRYQRQAIKEILAAEMGLILYDAWVDEGEAVHQADLQSAFDLGYDQWLELTEEHIRPVVDQFLAQAMADGYASPAEKTAILRHLTRLNTVVRLDLDEMEAQWGPLNLGNEVSAPGRGIPSPVKDAVWRRDGGRCVQCGSQAALEFDHIIPFSKGGASTYRNVQLLCQSCNRAKAAAIG